MCGVIFLQLKPTTSWVQGPPKKINKGMKNRMSKLEQRMLKEFHAREVAYEAVINPYLFFIFHVN